MVVIQNYAAQMEAGVQPLRVEEDGYGDDVDFEELEGGDGESAQAGGGALYGVPDPYLLPVAPVPSLPWRPAPLPSVREEWREYKDAWDLLPRLEREDTQRTPLPSSGVGARGPAVRPGGLPQGTLQASDGVSGDAGNRTGDHVSPRQGADGREALNQWPFVQDDRPRDGEHVR